MKVYELNGETLRGKETVVTTYSHVGSVRPCR